MHKVKLSPKHPKDAYPLKIDDKVIWVNKLEFTKFEKLPRFFDNIIKWFIVEEQKVEDVKAEIEPVQAIEVVKKVVQKRKVKSNSRKR